MGTKEKRMKTADLYKLPMEAVPRYKYFRKRANNLLDRTRQLLWKFHIDMDARKNMGKNMAHMAEQIRILVAGSQRALLKGEQLVKKPRDEYDRPMAVSEGLIGTLNNISDIVIVPFTTTITAEENSIWDKIREDLPEKRLPEHVLGGLVFVDTAPAAKTKEDVLQKMMKHHFDKFSSWTTKERLSKRCTTIGGLPSMISDVLEERVLNTLDVAEKVVKKYLDGRSFPFSAETSKQKIKTFLKQLSPHLITWKDENLIEHKRNDELSKAHERCRHSGSIIECKTCHLLDKVGLSVFNFLRSDLDNIMITSRTGFRYLNEKPNSTEDTFEQMRTDVIATIPKQMIAKEAKRPHRLKSAKPDVEQMLSQTEKSSEYDNTRMMQDDSSPKEPQSTKPAPPPKPPKEVQEVQRFLFSCRKTLVTAISAVQEKTFKCLFDVTKRPWIKKLRQVHWELTGLYEESVLEVFKRIRKEGPVLSKEAKDELFRSVSSVKGCGYCYGELRIDVTDLDTTKEDIEIQVRQCLNKYDINKFRLVQAKDIIKFHEAGSTIRRPDNHIGTIGGVVKVVLCHKNASKECQDLCALVSKHVVFDPKEVTVETDNTTTTLQNLNGCRISAEWLYDIAAVFIEEDKASLFHVGFKDFEGEEKKSRLIGVGTEEDDPFAGITKVHTWGAQSKPGRGIIMSDDYVYRGESMCPFLLFDDDDDDDDLESNATPFVTEGDSGAIILTNDDPEDENSMRVLAMLIGKLVGNGENGGYCAFKLADGLKHLLEVAKNSDTPIEKFIIDESEIKFPT